MSYQDPQSVKLEGADLEQARTQFAKVSKELEQFSGLLARTLGKTDNPRITRVVVELGPESADIGVSTFCSGNPPDHCEYVWDAAAGICRPCGPGDHACDPVTLNPPPFTPAMVLPPDQ